MEEHVLVSAVFVAIVSDFLVFSAYLLFFLLYISIKPFFSSFLIVFSHIVGIY